MSETILLGVPERFQGQIDLDRLQSLAPDARVIMTEDRDQMEAVIDDVTIAVGIVPNELIPQMPKLRWFQQWGAGANWLMDHPDAIEKDFILTNGSGIHAVPIAEHIFAMILAFGRNIHGAVRAQSRSEWKATPAKALFELPGKTMLLIGVGAIGQETARIASCFNVNVTGLRRNPDKSAPHVSRMVGPDQLDQVLPEADFVVITLPLTSETRNFFGRDELQLMKDDAYLVNIGRGEIVDEEAMIEALEEKRIAGAGLDVFETEPLPADSPLWSMENVIVTAHYSGATPRYATRLQDIFFDNLERLQKGESLRNVVQKELGY